MIRGHIKYVDEKKEAKNENYMKINIAGNSTDTHVRAHIHLPHTHLCNPLTHPEDIYQEDVELITFRG